jgi:hypothetical protein
MQKFDTEFKQRPDSGMLNASASKLSEKSPDYFGEIAINMKDMTNVRIEDGLHILKLSGWKRVAKSGKTYLSLGINRYVPEGHAPVPTQHTPVDDFPDSDIPF